MKNSFFLIALSAMCVAGCNSDLSSITLQSPSGETIELSVEVAATDSERQQGLMNRPKVDHGMLFIFEKTQPLSFWMKNTLIPLDIMFFDESGLFVSSATMTPCIADPCAKYAAQKPAKYALEMPAGFLKTKQIGKDWKIKQ